MYPSASRSNFWNYLDQIIQTQSLIIDRPRGSRHPRYPEIVYPRDYGYLEGTTSADGGGIDVWLGESGARNLSAVLVTVDLRKRDSEIKLLLGCDKQEAQLILNFHNQKNEMGAILVHRNKETHE